MMGNQSMNKRTVLTFEEHGPLVSKLLEVLNAEPSAVRQLVAIELVMARYAYRAVDERTAMFIAKSAHKHVTQILQQWFRG
jgi:hypothetical protein